MPRFIFHAQQGKFAGSPDVEDVLPDVSVARRAALDIYADLAKDIVNGLKEDSEWRLDVLDESGKAIFRIRLIAEELDDHVAQGDRIYAAAG